VARAKETAGEKSVGILGAGIARQCLEAGLLDEIVVYLAPVMLGDGVRLSSRRDGRVEMERIGLAQSGQLTDLRFRVRDYEPGKYTRSATALYVSMSPRSQRPPTGEER
jgi:dihydrofolate reductase